MNTRDEITINLHLTDKHQEGMEKDERPPTADGISFREDPCYLNALRTMLMKHERILSGEIGEITITEHRIDLVPNARTFMSAP